MNINKAATWVGGVGAAIIVTSAVYMAMNPPPPAGETQPVIAFSQAPYAHNMQFQATAPSQITYSGRYMVHSQQWGAFVLDLDKAANGFKMISPVGKNDPLFQNPVYPIWGDCWQSGVGVAATPFAPKWVVVWGTPKMCSKRCGNAQCEPRVFPEMIQVMRLDSPGFRFVGAVHAPKVPTLSDVILDGDFAYAKERRVGMPSVDKWTKIDLNALAVVAEGVMTVPARVLQTSVDGFTYKIVGVFPNPVPQPWPGHKNFQAIRSDTIIPTVPAPPAGTPAPPVTAIRTRVPTARTTLGGIPCDTFPAHVEHPVGLIEDEDLETLELRVGEAEGVPICTPTINRTRTRTPTRSPVVTVSSTVLPSTRTASPLASTPTVTPSPSLPAGTAPPTSTPTTAPAATPRPSPTKPSSGGCGNRSGSAVAGLLVAGVLLRMRRKA